MNEQRRNLLKASAAAGAASLIAGATAKAQTAPQRDTPARPYAPSGNPGDFDFLSGEWRIQHKRLRGPNDWDEFEGEATCFGILGGVASIEELRIPSRNFSGMGLRLLDVESRVWHDFWVNSKSGVLNTPGQTGGFEDGVGTFGADDVDGETPIKVRGVWDQITPNSCRWRQGVSRDGGATWEWNWFMDWTRAPTR